MESSKFTEIDEQFKCEHCGKLVPKLGYSCRNHCPYCLHSKHVDINPGDRQEKCHGDLEPVGLEINGKKGYVIIFKCKKCGEIRKNKVAKDDNIDLVIELSSKQINTTNNLKNKGITLIALVITIIILLILAGIAISQLTENGLFGKIGQAKNEHINAQNAENTVLESYESEIDLYGNTKKVVTAKNKEDTVNIREDYLLQNYFNINEEYKDKIKSIVFIDESDENKQVYNVNNLRGGEHIIKCKVTLLNDKEYIATTKLLVGKIEYISGEVNVDEYLNEEISLIGITPDATIITNRQDYFEIVKNLNIYNVTIKGPSISISASSTEVYLKNCKLDLSGYTGNRNEAGIVSNSYIKDVKIYFDNCNFYSEKSKYFCSWAYGPSDAYIKKNCNVTDLSQIDSDAQSGRTPWNISIVD